MTYTIEDYIKAQQAVEQAQQNIGIAGANSDIAASAFTEAQEGNLSPARLHVLQEDASKASAQARLAKINARKTAENTKGQATRENLEEMLGGMSAKELKTFINSYVPSFNEKGEYKGTGHKEAAELHADMSQIGGLLDYVNRGENNTKKNKALDQTALRLSEEFIRSNPKKYFDIDKDDPDFDEYVKAALELSYAAQGVRRDDFEKVAPDAIKKRQKDLYAKIRSGTSGSPSKDDLRSYISASIADEDIGQAMGGYAQAYINAQQAKKN